MLFFFLTTYSHLVHLEVRWTLPRSDSLLDFASSFGYSFTVSDLAAGWFDIATRRDQWDGLGWVELLLVGELSDLGNKKTTSHPKKVILES